MALSAAGLQLGDCYEEVVVDNLTRTQIVMYAGASGDFHPFHHDEVYARAMGQPGVFAHGMLTMALTGKMLTNYVGDGRLTDFSARFLGQVWPGDTLTATARVTAIRRDADALNPACMVELSLQTANQSGEEVLAGRASARIDP